jgi:hypothetical protein
LVAEKHLNLQWTKQETRVHDMLDNPLRQLINSAPFQLPLTSYFRMERFDNMPSTCDSSASNSAREPPLEELSHLNPLGERPQQMRFFDESLDRLFQIEIPLNAYLNQQD